MDFEVELKGGAPWGFRIQGGREFHSPIRINFLKPGGKASSSKALRVGDTVTLINTNPTLNMTHTQAEQAIKRAGTCLSLTVHRKEMPSIASKPPTLEKTERISEDNSEASENVAAVRARTLSSASSIRLVETSLPLKEKDPDWYKSMLKNFTSVEQTENQKVPVVLKKASVYEQEVEKINQYNAERSRRPSRQSLTGRPQKSAHVLAVAQSHEHGAPLRQYDEFVIDSSSANNPRSGRTFNRVHSEPAFRSFSYKPSSSVSSGGIVSPGLVAESRESRGVTSRESRDKREGEDDVFCDPAESSVVEPSEADPLLVEARAPEPIVADPLLVESTVPEPSVAEISAAEISTAEISTAEISAAEISAAEISTAEISAAEISAAEISAAEISAAEISAAEISAADISTAEISATDLSCVDTTDTSSALFENPSDVSDGEIEPVKYMLITRHISESESEGDPDMSPGVSPGADSGVESRNGIMESHGTQILLTAQDTHKLAEDMPSLQTAAFIMSPEFV